MILILYKWKYSCLKHLSSNPHKMKQKKQLFVIQILKKKAIHNFPHKRLVRNWQDNFLSLQNPIEALYKASKSHWMSSKNSSALSRSLDDCLESFYQTLRQQKIMTSNCLLKMDIVILTKCRINGKVIICDLKAS
jgi:hypothetical protein